MIKGTNILIRAIAEKDLDELILKLGDIKSLGEFLPIAFVSEAKFKRDFSEHGFIRDNAERYIIATLEDKIVGSIWIFKSIPYFNALEIGYHIFDSVDKRKNYATDAVQLLTDYAFNSKQINRLEIRIAVENIASEKVAIKSDYQHEGISREAAFSHGKYHNMHTYSLLRSEWEANKI